MSSVRENVTPSLTFSLEALPMTLSLTDNINTQKLLIFNLNYDI